MIRISLGNVGSGKTANEVREMFIQKHKLKTYTNITVKGRGHNIHRLTPDMIIKKEVKGQKKMSNGDKINVYDYALNIDYWKNQTEPINVVIDEIHNIVNARTSMSKKNQIFNRYLSMIRRVLGSVDAMGGNLVLVAQMSNQVDLIARGFCHQVRFHICHYHKTCLNCGFRWGENSEIPEPMVCCPKCKKERIKKDHHVIEIFHFSGMDRFVMWYERGLKTHYRHYYVNDIENFFGKYNTLQWDNLFEDY